MLALIITTAWIYSYTPLTDEDILLYWGMLSKAQKIEEIRKLDVIEHSVPVVTLTSPVAVLSGRDIYFHYLPGEDDTYPLQISIGGYLDYTIQIEDSKFTNFLPTNFKIYITIGAGCLAAGVIAGLLIPR